MCIRDRVITVLLFVSLGINALEERTTFGQESRLVKAVSRKELELEAKLPFVEYVRHKGYPVEAHEITTKDGYKLTFHRIQAKNQRVMVSKPVVYLQHGMFHSSDVWITNDEEKAPAFILANKGYDVWCGNVRGNGYSLGHTRLKNTDAQFWEFTWQHMTEYDLPAAFAYISNLTKKKINYIGHSLGTTIMFAALSLNIKEVVDNIDKYIAVGPVAFMRHVHNPFLKMAAKTDMGNALLALGVRDLYTPGFQTLRHKLVCSAMPRVCSNLANMFTEGDDSNRNFGREIVYLGHAPSGSSTRTLMHLQQMVNANAYILQKFDYGRAKNIEIYGQATPPMYKLTRIKQRIYLFVGKKDPLADTQDAKVLAELLPNVVYREYNFGHISFMWGKDMSYFNDVLKILSSQEEEATKKSD
eukprot:TRINITY_DN5455_c0_g2_i2.p1 TRINITY_DN5455_c0_g2~~TRINITY_DN5455_c0_g2_i2.p1  ORF type:complete len:437 (+),score=81.70 TRINITY_DN5455_c0_g2_i2:70-1311(+)